MTSTTASTAAADTEEDTMTSTETTSEPAPHPLPGVEEALHDRWGDEAEEEARSLLADGDAERTLRVTASGTVHDDDEEVDEPHLVVVIRRPEATVVADDGDDDVDDDDDDDERRISFADAVQETVDDAYDDVRLVVPVGYHAGTVLLDDDPVGDIVESPDEEQPDVVLLFAGDDYEDAGDLDYTEATSALRAAGIDPDQVGAAAVSWHAARRDALDERAHEYRRGMEEAYGTYGIDVEWAPEAAGGRSHAWPGGGEMPDWLFEHDPELTTDVPPLPQILIDADRVLSEL